MGRLCPGRRQETTQGERVSKLRHSSCTMNNAPASDGPILMAWYSMSTSPIGKVVYGEFRDIENDRDIPENRGVAEPEAILTHLPLLFGTIMRPLSKERASNTRESPH